MIRRRLWFGLTVLGLVVGVSLLVTQPMHAYICPCPPGWHCENCPGESCTCVMNQPAACGGTCTTLYQGHQLTNNCAYNGGNGTCWCPLPGTFMYGDCHQ